MHVLRNAIRKVMRGVCVCVCVWGGGGGALGKIQKVMQGKLTKEVKKKNSCRVSYTVGLTKCARLMGTWVVTLSWSFLGPGGIPINLIFSSIRKPTLFPLQADTVQSYTKN